jgi:hypothetical protein
MSELGVMKALHKGLPDDSVFCDFDARREPKTARYCIRCQKDLSPNQPARRALLRQSDMHLVAHYDFTQYPLGHQVVLLGLDCAARFGTRFSVPEYGTPEAKQGTSFTLRR